MNIKELEEFKDYISVLTPITVWKIAKKDKEDKVYYELNHIEDGHAESEKPLPIKPEFTNQKAWQNSEWQKRFAYLNEDYVVVY